MPAQVIVGLSGNSAASDAPLRAFLKSPRTLASGGETIEWAETDGRVLVEVELAVTIGLRTHRLREGSGEAAIASWSVANDVTLAERIHPDGYMQEAKGGIRFTPLGVASTTPPAPDARAGIRVNGTDVATSSLAALRVDAARAIEWVSSFMVLDEGDIVLTGSLAYALVEPGDEVTVWIEGLPSLTNPTAAR